MRAGSIASLGGIATITALGAAYLTFGVVRAQPFAEYTHATMVLTNSGGLGAGSPVLLSGIEVGRVTSIHNGADGVEVGFRVAADKHVPTDSTVTIEHLSTLGEPFVEFVPRTGNGPFLHDGQRVETSNIRMPLSIPDVARLVTHTLEQLDPAVVGALADTIDTALAGTESTIPNLTRASDLLTAAIVSRNTQIAQLFDAFQATAQNIDWAGPATAAAAPEFIRFTQALNDLAAGVGKVNAARPTSAYTEGAGLVPLLNELTAALRELAPQLRASTPALAPLVESVTTTAPQIDLSALISQALAGVGDDGAVHLQINVK
ncbi:MlaD family protein [Nocardia stercoris]|uniref:MCE family protein n=1 Tax=Nocardia stercoris TaxID=2483361 RepID=A0A3M2L556_9NOCA|nr:MlaD family protein [Nocardia stercoris]RMI32721.1 MCE family protein [Nocardia stercoris]